MGLHSTIKQANEDIKVMNASISGYMSPYVSIQSKHTHSGRRLSLSLTLDLNLSLQPGKKILYRVEGKGRERRISARPGAFAQDNYHVSATHMPAYEEALVNYLKGILSCCLLLS